MFFCLCYYGCCRVLLLLLAFFLTCLTLTEHNRPECVRYATMAAATVTRSNSGKQPTNKTADTINWKNAGARLTDRRQSKSVRVQNDGRLFLDVCCCCLVRTEHGGGAAAAAVWCASFKSEQNFVFYQDFSIDFW